ncbi:hypothetical protein [Brucella pseudogrignonensis]|nr:hypothetical protein [Brucella pseudogrignonensis]
MMMTRDHNTKTEQELYEEQKFLEGFANLKSMESDMAGTKGDMNAEYKRLKDLGWSKKDYDFAKSLEDKDVGQVIADFERKLRIARMFGHQLGRQLDILDKDRTPQEDRAYDEGFAAGRRRKSATNPYQPGSQEFQNWQKGMNDGTELANKDLSSVVSEEAPE